MIVRPVAVHEWDVVAWLWPDFRHDLAVAGGGLSYADGRDRHGWLDEHPRADGTGWAETAGSPDHWIRTS